MPWYESQLIGTIIGTVLGFLLSYIPNAIERIRTRRCLLRLLRAEISSITEQLRERVVDYRDSLESMLKGEPCEIYFSDRRLDEIFAANLVNIASINSRRVSEILSFYQVVSKYRGLVKALSLTNLNPEEDNSDFCKQLEKVIAFIESGVARGDCLVERLL